MRRYLSILLGAAFLLFATAVIAQTSSSSGQYSNPSSTNSQASPNQTGTSGAQKTAEGCIAKQGTDFFLIPKSGNPVKLQASNTEELTEHEGHQVKVSGTESSLSAAGGTSGSETGTSASSQQPSSASGTSAGTSGTAAGSSGAGQNPSAGTSGSVGASAGTSGASAGTSASSNNLEQMATEQMSVSKIKHIAASCPANWNPSVPMPSSTPSSH